MRSIHSYPLPFIVRSKLYEAGFQNNNDFKDISVEELKRESGLTLEDVELVLKTIWKADTPLKFLVTGNVILQNERSSNNIVTFSQKLDEVLEGGVPLGKITEICGCPGIGKTQLCLQLCVDVQIPKSMGGLHSEAIFIDTEQTFFTQRLVEIAKAAVEHCNLVYATESDEILTVDCILKGIQYLHCKDYVQLISLVNQLPDILDKYEKVKLVIIDSIAFHFRYGFEGSFYERTKILNNLTQSLLKVVSKRKIALVWTNQMTTKFCGKKTELVPSLGDIFAHHCNLKLLLYWDKDCRKALLQKSPSHSEVSVPFQIIKDGIRDCAKDDDDDEEYTPKRLKIST